MKDNLINQCNIEKDREKMRTRRMAAKTEKLVKEKENTLKERKDIEVRIHKNYTFFFSYFGSIYTMKIFL